MYNPTSVIMRPIISVPKVYIDKLIIAVITELTNASTAPNVVPVTMDIAMSDATNCIMVEPIPIATNDTTSAMMPNLSFTFVPRKLPKYTSARSVGIAINSLAAIEFIVSFFKIIFLLIMLVTIFSISR